MVRSLWCFINLTFDYSSPPPKKKRGHKVNLSKIFSEQAQFTATIRMQPHSLYKGIKQLAHTTGSLIIVNKEHTNTIRQKPIIMRGQSSQSRKRHLNSNFWFMCKHGEPDALHATGNLNQ